MVKRCIKVETTSKKNNGENELRISIPSALDRIIQEVKESGEPSDLIQLQIGFEEYIPFMIKPNIYSTTAVSKSGNSILNIVMSPVVDEGCIYIKQFSKRNNLKLEDMIIGKDADAIITILKTLIAEKNSFSISGAQGTGKSTLVKCLYDLASSEDEIVCIDDISSKQEYLDALKFYNQKKQVFLTHYHKQYSDFAEYMDALVQAENSRFLKEEIDSAFIPYNIELKTTLDGTHIISRMVKLEQREAGIQEKVIFYYNIEKKEYCLND